MSRILNEDLEGSKVSYLSNAFHVVELVTMLLDALITKERCLKKVIEAIIPMLKVMTHSMVVKTLEVSWHMIRRMQKLKKLPN